MAGGTADERGDFFAVLLQDHARIEAQLEKLVHAANALIAVDSNTAAALQVFTDTLRFFATEGARHEDVEENVLFPRIRPLPAFQQILSALEWQHRMNRTEASAFEARVRRFEPAHARELRRLAVRFVEMHRGHAVAEERALFTLAQTALSPAVIAEMSRESRQRKPAAGATGD